MSKCKTRRRRASINLHVPSFSVCPTCKAPKMSHRVCFNCGKYNGREIISLEEAAQS
jgi:large subunit ribosomal protein L32